MALLFPCTSVRACPAAGDFSPSLSSLCAFPSLFALAPRAREFSAASWNGKVSTGVSGREKRAREPISWREMEPPP